MNTIVKFSLCCLTILVVASASGQTDLIREQKAGTLFPKGEKITSNNFAGTAWLQMLVKSDSTYNTSVGNVTFEPKARTNWHKHPGGQILLVTEGKGFYQERDRPAQLIQKGDIVKIPPGIEHWHGAAPDSGLTHIAMSLNTDKGGAVWSGPVTDEEYHRSTK